MGEGKKIKRTLKSQLDLCNRFRRIKKTRKKRNRVGDQKINFYVKEIIDKLKKAMGIKKEDRYFPTHDLSEMIFPEIH